MTLELPAINTVKMADDARCQEYGGIDYTKWAAAAEEANAVDTAGDGYYVTESGETCTDGKDDGKVGFFEGLGQVVKGIGKGIVNTVKGAFTDSEGNFSLGKTLLSLGTAAVCVACPAVGLGLCAVGAVSGAVQVGKGIYNAATAETDGEAKEALQDIGSGGVTVGLSVAGAKGSLKAIKSSSTAGLNGGSALEEAKGGTLLDKAKALGKDSWSSTKNNGLKIYDSAKQIGVQKTNAKLTEAKAELGEIETEFSEAGYKLKEAQENKYLDYEEAANNFESAKAKQAESQAKVETLQEAADKGQEYLDNLSPERKANSKDLVDYYNEKVTARAERKAEISELKKQIKEAKEKGEDTEVLQENLKNKKAEGKLFKEYRDSRAEGKKSLKEAKENYKEVKAKENATEAEIKAAKDEVTRIKKENKLIKKGENTTEALDEIKVTNKKGKLSLRKTVKNLTPKNMAKLAKAMGKDGEAILNKVLDGTTFEALSQEFGYETAANAAEVIMAFNELAAE